MTRYRHIDCGGFVRERTHSTRTKYYICRQCLAAVGPESVEEVEEVGSVDEDIEEVDAWE